MADARRYLVETDWLEAHLGDPGLRIFDCTTHLVPVPKVTYRVESGRGDWERVGGSASR